MCFFILLLQRDSWDTAPHRVRQGGAHLPPPHLLSLLNNGKLKLTLRFVFYCSWSLLMHVNDPRTLVFCIGMAFWNLMAVPDWMPTLGQKTVILLGCLTPVCSYYLDESWCHQGHIFWKIWLPSFSQKLTFYKNRPIMWRVWTKPHESTEWNSSEIWAQPALKHLEQHVVKLYWWIWIFF